MEIGTDTLIATYDGYDMMIPTGSEANLNDQIAEMYDKRNKDMDLAVRSDSKIMDIERRIEENNTQILRLMVANKVLKASRLSHYNELKEEWEKSNPNAELEEQYTKLVEERKKDTWTVTDSYPSARILTLQNKPAW